MLLFRPTRIDGILASKRRNKTIAPYGSAATGGRSGGDGAGASSALAGASATFGRHIVVILNVAATITLWREAVRRPPKPKKRFINALLYSKPIARTHQPPKSIGEDFPSLVTEEDQLFFSDFADFAAVVNWFLTGEHVAGPGDCKSCQIPRSSLTFRTTPGSGGATRYSTIKPALAHSKSLTAFPTAPKHQICALTSN
jgi:hypothetical protein